MPILVLAHDDVRKLLPLNECVTVMREALLSLAAGRVHQPLRMVVRPPEAAGLMALMPSFLGGDAPRFGLKRCACSTATRRWARTRTGDDLAAVSHLYAKAQKLDVDTWVDF
jgi:hypothetical protein